MDFEKTLEPYLDETEIASLLNALEKPSVHGVVLNPKKITDEEFLALCPNARKHPFVPHAYLYEKEEYDLGKSLLYDLGAISIQDPSSMMVPFFLNPRPGDKVLDYCAAPGGKTVLSSFLMGEEGVILSNDLSYPRAKDLSQNIERLGLGNVAVISNDLSNVDLKERFDKIILDVPCSGTAMFRKNEAAKEEWSLAKMERCVASQKEILERAFSLLSPGGTLAYSTCSFCYQEDEGVILPFLKSHPEAEAVPLWDDPRFFRSSSLPEAIHFFPHRFEGEGQFLCVIRKRGQAEARVRKTPSSPKEFSNFLSRYGLLGRDNRTVGNLLSSLSEALDLKGCSVLRYGVRCLDLESASSIPEQHLARFLPGSACVPLSEGQAKKYLIGETFALETQDGIAPVAYENRSIGWVKVKGNMAKNHYPKGLRHRY